MHEREVGMRLKFESKLNNITGMYRELESRFLVVSKELFLNSNRLNNLYLTLNDLRKYKEDLMKLNSDLQTKNFAIEEKIKLNDTLVQQKNENIKDLQIKLDEFKELTKNLKENLALKEANIRNLETKLKVKDENNNNLASEKDIKSEKLTMREDFIKHQEIVIQKLSSDLISERSEGEETKNRLTVSIIKIKEISKSNL